MQCTHAQISNIARQYKLVNVDALIHIALLQLRVQRLQNTGDNLVYTASLLHVHV